MNDQNLLLLAVGLFFTLILTVAAVDQYLLDEHPPSEVGGLLWRVQNAYSRIQDLEAVIEVSEGDRSSVRMLVQYVAGTSAALSLEYLGPEALDGEKFIIENDQLSHYLPDENLVVVKRWIGVPLAGIAVSGLGLTSLEEQWENGELAVQILENAAGTTEGILDPLVTLPVTLTSCGSSTLYSFCLELTDPLDTLGFARSITPTDGPVLQGAYILEIRDTDTYMLRQMVWIERESYMIQKIVYYDDGERDKVVRVQRITLDQGLTTEEIIAVPRGVITIRG